MNPLCRRRPRRLFGRLLDEGYTVLLETNGSIDIRGVDQKCIRIVDIKCPLSGMDGQNNLNNLKNSI